MCDVKNYVRSLAQLFGSDRHLFATSCDPIIIQEEATAHLFATGLRAAGRQKSYSWEVIMAILTIELPEGAFSALCRSPQEFAKEMRIAAAIQWYAQQQISQEKVPKRRRRKLLD